MKMLIESDPHETRIAIVEENRLTETFLERRNRRGFVGNIYKGRISRVLPGMQAAFVDIGLERDAFLYVDDVTTVGDGDGTPFARWLEENDGGADDRPRGGFESAEVRIEDLLRSGQELLVQVTKDPLRNKGARVTTHVTLPSRYLVLLPTVDHVGVSRRIEEEGERERLRAVLEAIPEPPGGLIVRTAGEGRGEEELGGDAVYLSRLWRQVWGAGRDVSAPTLLYRDLDLAARVVRDRFTCAFSGLWVNDRSLFERLREFLAQVQPTLVERVRLADGGPSLFERFGVEQELEAALASKVWLPSGGYLVINQTEALVAIDVNTGRFVGQETLEATALETNLEAVKEVVRQIRLRDLSGILVLDLIDMEEPQHRDQVFAALEQELKKDRAKSKLLKISEFGLVEVTRKRSHANLERVMTRPCPYCDGRGRIKTVSTVCLDLRRKLLQGEAPGGRGAVGTPDGQGAVGAPEGQGAVGAPEGEGAVGAPEGQDAASDHETLVVRVHPEVAEALQTTERAILDELEGRLEIPILIESDANMHRERYEIRPR